MNENIGDLAAQAGSWLQLNDTDLPTHCDDLPQIYQLTHASIKLLILENSVLLAKLLLPIRIYELFI